ncbi:hypothetical protein JAAARDRAFT_48356 [Jaapia argillacea MUCL 33604]|uniref:F-box domain-containing protein n=1 Tax=Jaapia argillacea MUCL 33604 TaxID=933084 RepID=A0A067PXE1_9AGAM|nr:hypothetical protein JAAARDRAFT_48356 [Jaapia argillacea MUCL 33604]
MQVEDMDLSPSSNTTSLPFELVLYILKLASASSHISAENISRVCRHARQESLPYLFATILITPNKEVGADNIPYPHFIQNLWLDLSFQDEDEIRCPQALAECDVLSQPNLTNITHLALPTVTILAWLDCDTDTHEGPTTTLANLAQCRSLTFFRFDECLDIHDIPQTEDSLFNNITHVQLHCDDWSLSDRDHTRDRVGWLVHSLRCLTHLALPFPEFTLTSTPVGEFAPYHTTLWEANVGRTVKGRPPLEQLVMVVDWKAWVEKWARFLPEGVRRLLWVSFVQEAAATEYGGRICLVEREFGSEEGGRGGGSDYGGDLEEVVLGSEDADPCFRVAWRDSVSGGETIWDKATKIVEAADREYHRVFGG